MGKGNRKSGGLNISLIIQDEGWNKLATFKWNTADLKKQSYIVKTLNDAFGINFNKKTDLDWSID